MILKKSKIGNSKQAGKGIRKDSQKPKSFMKIKRNFIKLYMLIAALLPTFVGEAATFVVTNTADSGAGSLRQLITSAATGSTITFATNLSGGVITLTSGQITLSANLIIDASALPGGIQIQGNGTARIFNVGSSVAVVLTALSIAGGIDQSGTGGGGIYNSGVLTVNGCTLAGDIANNVNGSTAGGGAIFNTGTLTLNQSTLAANHAIINSSGGGGGIFNAGTLTVNQSTITGNSADNNSTGGGGIYNSGTVTIFNSIVAGNSTIGGFGADIFGLVNDNINFVGANIVLSFSGSSSGPIPISAAPQLAALGNYGGPTLTLPPLTNSPAINACFDTGNFTSDQRGLPRVPGGLSDLGSVQLAPPAATTLPVASVVNSNATLNAVVNPNTLATSVWFQWGVTNNPYSNQTPPVFLTLGNTNTSIAISNQLTSLTPGVVYHCRVVATNIDGVANGNDVLFGSAPVVTLFGGASVTNECHTLFTDPGATNAAGLHVTVTGLLNTNSPNVYQLVYTTTNSLGLAGSAIRLVTVVDTTAPVITILGANPLTILTNTPFIDPGANALDACGGSFIVTNNSNVNPTIAGSYTVTYSSMDSYNNTATAIRNVIVRTHLNFVTTTNDSGSGSLRQAVASSYFGDDIDFAPNLSGSTILLTNGELVITNNLTIDGSTLPGGIQINGNGISRIFNVAGGTNVLTSLIITNGNASSTIGGGGIYNAGFLTVNQCTLAGNSADNGTVSQSGGGGIYNNGWLTLNGCTLAGNHANTNKSLYGGGGGAICNNNTLYVNQCTLTGNSANDGDAGAGFSYGGGGIYSSGNAYVNQSTLTGNHADSKYLDVAASGGGIYAYLNLAITNSIIAENTAVNTADIECDFVYFGGSNIVQDSDAEVIGNTPIDAAPQLAALGNYGGPTQTMPPLPGSPAIDACSSSDFTTDQRGFPRLIGAFPDIGAVEGIYNTNGPGKLTGLTRLGNGAIQFTFTNYTDASFTVLASTNLALPTSTWNILGHALESPIGSDQYPFTDPQATNITQRFYRVRMP